MSYLFKLLLHAHFTTSWNKVFSWRCGVVVITIAQLHSIKTELKFCAGLNPACRMSEIHYNENLWQWSLLEIRLNPFHPSIIPEKQFIPRHAIPMRFLEEHYVLNPRNSTEISTEKVLGLVLCHAFYKWNRNFHSILVIQILSLMLTGNQNLNLNQNHLVFQNSNI